MFHCNIRHSPKNLVKLEDFLYPLNKRPEILAVTETRLNKNSVCNVELLRYEHYHTDSPASACGAALYITKTLKSIPRPDIEFNMQLVESCWVEIDPCNRKATQCNFRSIEFSCNLNFLSFFLFFFFVVALKSLCPFLYASPLFSLSVSL